MPLVRIKSGQGAGTEFELGDAPLVVGRDDRAEIQIVDQGVSRRHAEFFRIGEMYFIRDLDSRNGTYVNEERISEELLRDGDEVRIAATVLLFEGTDRGARAQPQHHRRFRASPEADATTTIQIDDHLARDLDDLAEPAHQRSRDLKHLYRCSQLIAEARGPQELCDAIARLAGDAIDADHACIFLRVEGAQEFELKSCCQQGGGRSTPPVIATEVIVDVVRSKRAVLVSEEEGEHAPHARAHGPLGAGRPASVLGAPIVAHDQVHGVLYCACADPHRFSSEAIDLLTSIGIQTGIALQGMLLHSRQERVLLATVRTLSSLLETRDALYVGHAARVASYCQAIARALKLPRSEGRRIQLAALLHNVSKLALPPDVPDDETDPDIVAMRNELSHKLIAPIEGLEFVLPVITTYLERMDGAGIPNRLSGDSIPLAARILAVADQLDTLLVRGDPPEAGPLGLREALLSVRQDAPARFDMRVVEALLVAYRDGSLRPHLPAGTICD